MEIKTCIKESFTVIGKEGSTEEGQGFIQRLWADANSHFGEVAALAKKDENGSLVGVWGAMSDCSRSFRPWDDFNRGLYLAGVECRDDVEAPAGWTKWVVPGFEYLYVKAEGPDTFTEMLDYMRSSGLSLAGAVHDFTDPKTGENFMFFPVRKL